MQRRRMLRRPGARRAVASLLMATVVFGAVAVIGGAHESGRLGDVALIDYREECVGEGCSNHEIEELWDSFHEECFGEGCYTEEVFELSGGPRYHSSPYIWESDIPDLFQAFRSRLGKTFDDPAMIAGVTQDFGNWLKETFDGYVFTSPEVDWCYPTDTWC